MQTPFIRFRLLRLLLPLAIFVLGCPPPQPPPQPLPPPGPAQPATIITVLGRPSNLAPGSQSSLLVRVWDNPTGRPATNARVQVTLGTPGGGAQQVYQGETDDQGLLLVTFQVPEPDQESEHLLAITAETDSDIAQYEEEVYVGRVYNVLLSTDKPVYQPGQVIHVRGLALDSLALEAAQDQALLVTVDDPQGNRLMRRELTTSSWGIAGVDFALDSQAPSGDYLITAQMGPVRSSRTVEVKPYRLPRFKVEFSAEDPFSLPGDLAQGRVDAHYFFGKPVAGGQVRILGFVTDVEKQQIFELLGQTDAQGRYDYQFQVPDYFAGQLENDTAQVDLEITVTDTAGHPETVSESVTVAEHVLLVEAVPESGRLRPGLENVVYFQVSTPDGRSTQAALTVNYGDLTETVQTDEFGLATLTITPTSDGNVAMDVTASVTDQEGGPDVSVQTQVVLDSAGGDDVVLLRPDKAEYAVGETLNLDIYVAGSAQTAYLDVVKGQQTFGLAALPVQEGVAQAAIDLDGSLLGTLELHAYVMRPDGEIARDRRLILVNPAPAQVAVQADREVYRPGDTAILDVAVSREGEPMAGVLGVSIVDESVFSVGAQDPGFARTYFLLERELSEARYEIHDFVPLQADDPSPYDTVRPPVRSTGQIRSGNTQIQTSQQLALFGFFAQELALTAEPSPVPEATPDQITQDRVALAWGWGGRAALALPLLGLALYDGSRRRRQALIAFLLLGLSAFVWSACAAPMAAPAASDAAMEAPAVEEPAEPMTETTATRGGSPKEIRLRQFFPETLFWMPEVETDAGGHARLQVPIADSITTWRVSILASDRAGNLGSAETGLRVFQDFFVEPDLPRFLTVGDEIAVPVSVFNYLDRPQQVTLAVEPGDWFEFVQEPDLTLEIGSGEVTAAYLPIRVTGFGQHALTISAAGDVMSDAVRRDVEVLPDGQPARSLVNGQVAASNRIPVTVPDTAIPGTARVVVKLYPGVVSQVLEGLEGLLQQPYGCFEQTSSTTYPNVLVLDYLKSTGQVAPQIQLQAEQYINLGYQRLLTFETNVPGGFSLFGEPPPWTMLTAYGLMEFSDMSRVSYVDPLLIERTARYLFGQQQADGRWRAEGMTVESGWERLGNADLPVTAYIAWSLADAGYAETESVQRALGYVKTELARLQGRSGVATSTSPLPTAQTQTVLDPYALAIVANALVAANPADPVAQALLDGLVARADGDGDQLFWRSDLSTYMGGQGNVASIETTAMVAIALLRSGRHPQASQAALDYLVGQRDSFGTFYTTQATILSLKALLLGTQLGEEQGTSTVTLTLNGDRAQTVTLDDTNGDVVQQIVFDDIGAGEQVIDLSLVGERSLQYQVMAEYYQPWYTVVDDAPERQQELRVDVFYDRTTLAVNDVVNVTALVEMLAPGTAGTVLVDLGLPPGFTPLTEDLDALVEQGQADRYELTGRQILFYLTDVPSGRVYRLEYRLRARYPIRAQTSASRVYDYYTPDRQDVTPPQRIIVTLGTP